jgi:hypothetical protein
LLPLVTLRGSVAWMRDATVLVAWKAARGLSEASRCHRKLKGEEGRVEEGLRIALTVKLKVPALIRVVLGVAVAVVDTKVALTNWPRSVTYLTQFTV